MNSDFITESSLTFHLKTSEDIQEILQLIRVEAHKENCSGSDVTLITTAVSEMCRCFLKHSNDLELSLTMFNDSGDLKLKGKVFAKTTPHDAGWNTILQNLSTYFNNAVVRVSDDPVSVSYQFYKEIPGSSTTHHF